MRILKKHLEVKTSQIPDAGMGLFTRVDIPKGTYIIEYKGKITSWNDADHMDGDNPFLFHVHDDHVIDGSKKKSLAKYANDAKGLTRIKGLKNNSEFVEDGVRVYIQAARFIASGSEIFVDYGPDYWKTVKENIKIQTIIDAEKAAKKAKKKKQKKK